ncbi:mediator complex subunit MED14-domain-containing protein [Syncephalastrum racemosum]|uniref:Mediator of RNA polymerase II transcription subunit 14 n=1 Tax=Syncephalastrum racemosum TaxID=13706 RepID=A0A1X2HHE1_SYNRA|nr:mediator complex subunit MED14-domain-containing protein [Syncephalastrum racemosum]
MQTIDQTPRMENNKDDHFNDALNGTKPVPTPPAHDTKTTEKTKTNGDADNKVVLPNEMACMVPLKILVGKLIRKAYEDLMTLTDTLPSRSDVEKKRQILQHVTFYRKQILKLQVLVKWAEDANDIQMCQNIMAFLANQNQVFRDTTHFLHKIHSELPAARIRNFDILSAVDVLTTGTYQRMPTKYEDMIPPRRLTDGEVLETFRQMNDVIRMRIMTDEVLPMPMQDYRIESGRVSFAIENEFEVSLTLIGPPHDRQWWIVSLDVLVRSTAGSGAADVDISLNDHQRHHLRVKAQDQLVPANARPPVNGVVHQPGISQSVPNGAVPSDDTKTRPFFFPLVNLYDYLHLFCLDMQLEVMFMQATMIARTRWLEQLKVQMDQTRTKLTLVYWEGGSPAAHWAHPQLKTLDNYAETSNSTTIEVSISNESEKQKGPFSAKVHAAIAVRDELQSLIHKAGLGASVALANIDPADKPKLVSALKYPKTALEVLWGGVNDLHSEKDLLNPSDLNVERILWHVTRHHALCIINKFRELLKEQESFLNEHGLYIAQGRIEDILCGGEVPEDTKTAINDEHAPEEELPSLVIRYRHHRYISIGLDMRTGRVKVREAGYRLGEGDVKLRELEKRLGKNPAEIARHLLWLRSEVVIREIVSLAKQLSLQPFHPSQLSLRPDDFIKLFGDLPVSQTPVDSVQKAPKNQPRPPGAAPQRQGQYVASRASQQGSFDSVGNDNGKAAYPSHCVFLQFAQFEDWYLVVAIVRNEVHSWLCCINKTYDHNGLFQVIVDLMHVDYEEMWKEQFMQGDPDAARKKKKRRHGADESDKENRKNEVIPELATKRRRKSSGSQGTAPLPSPNESEVIDNLSIDLRFMAKLDSLCRAYITNRKIEQQLRQSKSAISYRTRPLLSSLPTPDAQVMNHPAAGRMEVLCVPQRDLLKSCLILNIDESNAPQNSAAREALLHSQPWVEALLSQVKNEVVMRASGWWACGRSECFVVIQDKFNWGNLSLRTYDISDHISLDKATNVLSFTYTEIDTCIDRFLRDWERIFMMTNLARQVSSKWLSKFGDQLRFEAFNMQELKFTYAKEYACSIRWDALDTTRARQYVINLDLATATETRTSGMRPLQAPRNPHWRVSRFLQDLLSDKRDLVYFIQMLFQTLPLMACLEKMETDSIQNGALGAISIIPRVVDAVRIVYPSLRALDISFTNPETICVSDAAYHHTLYPSFALSDIPDNALFPMPYVSPAAYQHDAADGAKRPIKVAQQLKYTPFTEFAKLVEDLDDWIFEQDAELPGIQVPREENEREPTAIGFKHGFLCSASLCPAVLSRLSELLE